MSEPANPLRVTAAVVPSAPTMLMPAEPAANGRVVGVMIFLAVAIFLSALTLLYYRWLTVSVPSAELLVSGTKVPEGASVTVSGPSLAEPLTVVVGPQTQRVARFYLQPGYYTLRVVLPDQQQVVAERSVTLLAGRRMRIQLSDASPQATQPGRRSP